jgi:glucose-1-phosphate thymidylyltransferase
MHDSGEKMIDDSVKMEHSIVIQPSFVGKNVVLKNAIVGPNVAIGEGCVVEKTVISNSIVQNNSTLKDAVIDNAMIGSHVVYYGESKDLSIGDYSTHT